MWADLQQRVAASLHHTVRGFTWPTLVLTFALLCVVCAAFCPGRTEGDAV